MQIVGGENLDIVAYGGSLEVGTASEENAPEIEYLKLAGGSGNPSVIVGRKTTFVDVAGSINQYVGTLDLQANHSGSFNSLNQYAGKLTLHRDSDQQFVYIYGGTCDYRSAVADTIQVWGPAVFDATHCESSTIAQNIQLHAGATFKDPHQVINKILNLDGCTLDEVTLVLPVDKQITYT